MDLQGGNVLTVHLPRVRLNLIRKRRRSEEQPTWAALAANEEDERSHALQGVKPWAQERPVAKFKKVGVANVIRHALQGVKAWAKGRAVAKIIPLPAGESTHVSWKLTNAHWKYSTERS